MFSDLKLTRRSANVFHNVKTELVVTDRTTPMDPQNVSNNVETNVFQKEKKPLKIVSAFQKFLFFRNKCLN